MYRRHLLLTLYLQELNGKNTQDINGWVSRNRNGINR